MFLAKLRIVTGGSRGIGEMISAGFLANGEGLSYNCTQRRADLLKS